MRFHVLGLGSIGSLIAFHLRSTSPKAPISLIVKAAQAFPLRRRAHQGLPLPPLGPDSPDRDYAAPEQAQVGVERDGKQRVVGGFDVEIWGKTIDSERIARLKSGGSGQDSTSDTSMEEPIDSLIVTLKTPHTLRALTTLKPRLSPSSVVALLQNGMGVYDELCTNLWPDPVTRPYFILGTTTHGVTPTPEPGRVVHRSRAGQGEIKWGIVPDPRKVYNFEHWIWGSDVGSLPILSPPHSPELPLSPSPDGSLDPLRNTLEALLSLHSLSSSLSPMPHLHHEQLLKLALNSIINPLTAILGSGRPNGILGTSKVAYVMIEQLSAEISAILTAYIHQLALPHTVPSDLVRLFSEESIRYRAIGLARATSRNVSSMAGDVVKGRVTEVDYINGYLISLGQRLGINAPQNRLIRQMVKFKAELNGLYSSLADEPGNGGRNGRVGRQLFLEPSIISKPSRKLQKKLEWQEKKRAKTAHEQTEDSPGDEVDGDSLLASESRT